MATVLDAGLIGAFDIIFPVLLVFALLFAVLQKTKAIGSSVAINAIVAVAVAFMVLLSESLIALINFMIPWFAVAIIFFLLMIFIFRVFGASEDSIASAIGKNGLQWVIIVVGVIILIAGLGQVYGGSVAPYVLDNGTAISGEETTEPWKGIAETILHPKVLGLIIIFAVMFFAVLLLSAAP